MKQFKWGLEKDIHFLLKTTKSEYIQNSMQNGVFYFNRPEFFSNNNNGLNKAQEDKYDSFITADIINVYYSELSNGNYEKPKKLCDKATLRLRSNDTDSMGICCFRKVTFKDLIPHDGNYILRLGDTVDRIKEEFGHDAFILIVYPDDFIHRVSNVCNCFGRSVDYGRLDGEYVSKIFSKNLVHLSLFQKRIEYAWQKEYRIIKDVFEDKDKFISIGSIEDIALSDHIDVLKSGIVIHES